MLRAMGASVVAMVLMLVIGPTFIRWLRLNEFGQNIREDGPANHKTKEGTPTMGGVLIWFAVLVPYVIFSRFSVASMTVVLAALGNALIGFVDDWTKIVRKRSLGLAARYKLLLQLGLSLFIGFIALHYVGLDTRVDLPFTSLKLDLGGFGFYALIFLVLAGFSNAVNLTDGLDGLAAGASAIVLVALAGIAFLIGRNTNDPGISDLMVVAGCVGGACLGFLWYNTFPADVFMGDTGSLGLGGAIAGMAVLTRTELTLVIVGGLFVIEALSVMAQVVSFKLFGRRVLLMAPLHHHFELKAWSEAKIIVRFWIVAALFAGAGFAVYYATFRG
jgi:phospho-N-acetylmuramoyl-pentapeptide-transferase